jgi:hypothetical protein
MAVSAGLCLTCPSNDFIHLSLPWYTQEYEDEGIKWSFIDFKDNAPVLELLEGRMGLVTVLVEECRLAKGGCGEGQGGHIKTLRSTHSHAYLLDLGDCYSPLNHGQTAGCGLTLYVCMCVFGWLRQARTSPSRPSSRRCTRSTRT